MDWPKCEDLVGNVAEIARNRVGWSLVSDEVCLDKTCVVSRKEMPNSP